MPIYDYVCRACGKEFEVLVMGGAKPKCPECQGEDLAKQMSTFAHKSGGTFSSSGGSGCGSCTSSNCDTCH